MALGSRLTLTDGPEEDAEDFFGASLGAIFPDDVMNLHGDADHGLLYQSPHLPKPLNISLASPDGEEDRRLFSHYVWDASLLLAEFIEAGTLKLQGPSSSSLESPHGPPLTDFDVTGLTTVELGAGTALPSMLAALLGAKRVVMTDYPAQAVVSNLRANAARNLKPDFSPLSELAAVVEVEGHSWGDLSSPLAVRNHHAFDRVLVCDCLWMPWQHTKLLDSIGWFLKDDEAARCWLVAGFHTGRENMREFFRDDRLARVGLEVERIWERDCDGAEREWAWDKGAEDVAERKRWLAFATLKRRPRSGERQ